MDYQNNLQDNTCNHNGNNYNHTIQGYESEEYQKNQKRMIRLLILVFVIVFLLIILGATFLFSSIYKNKNIPAQSLESFSQTILPDNITSDELELPKGITIENIDEMKNDLSEEDYAKVIGAFQKCGFTIDHSLYYDYVSSDGMICLSYANNNDFIYVTETEGVYIITYCSGYDY